MKIVAVSLTYNDGYKLDEWRINYEIYKNQVDKFVIVDNASTPEYKEKLKRTFPEAIIIERKTNGGCTGAYNDGIKYALEKTDADAILIVGNDIRPTRMCVPRMYEYLMSDPKLGIVSSAILFKNQNKIDYYGYIVNGIYVTRCNVGQEIETITEKDKLTDLVAGGFTMAKREFYEKVGLQDDNLFMYCDEIDTTYKARNAGFAIGVIADEYAWHWHINPPSTGKRSSSSRYLISRNRVYLANKYFGFSSCFNQFVRGTIFTPSVYLYHYIKSFDRGYLKDARYSFIGALHGFFGKMNKKEYIKFD